MILHPSFYFNLHALAMLIVGLTIFFLGLFIFFKKKSSRINISFFTICLSITVWLIATAIGCSLENEQLATVWFKIDNFGVMFISVSILFFTKSVLKKKDYLSVYVGYILALLLGIIILSSDWLVTGVKRFSWGYFPQWGWFGIPALVFFFGYMLLSFYILFRYYIKEKLSPLKKNQLKYLILAYLIAYTGSIDFLPVHGFEVYPTGYISIFLFLIIIAYAIFKYNLVDIEIVITRGTIFGIVYSIVLGLPFLFGFLTKEYLIGYVGELWWLFPVVIAVIIASLGPTTYNKLKNKAEWTLFKEQKEYQEALVELGRQLTLTKNINELLVWITRTISINVGVSYTRIFLWDEEKKEYLYRKGYGKEMKKGINAKFTPDNPLIKLIRSSKKPLLRAQ